MPSRRSLPRGARTAAILCGSALAVFIWLFSAYTFYLNHRISNELLNEQWKTPIEIYSSIRPGSGPFVKV